MTNKQEMIDIVVRSTRSWLDYLDYKAPSEADEEDITIGLTHDHPAILNYLQVISHFEYTQIISAVLDQLHDEEMVDA